MEIPWNSIYKNQMLSNINYSIQYYYFVCFHLSGFKYCEQS